VRSGSSAPTPAVGSYARGALGVGDVDLAVEFDQTKEEAGIWFATLMAGGFDHLRALRRELRASQRALELHFNELEDLRKQAFEPRLLWRRGDSLAQAHARLAALAPDASAQRAPRDSVHPLLAEVEQLIPRPARQEFSLFVWAGWLDAKLVELPREQAANTVTRRRSALVRVQPAFSCSARRRELSRTRGSRAAQCRRNALLRRAGDARCGARLLAAARRRPLRRQAAPVGTFDFGQGISRVLVVLNPTARTQTLRALDMRARVDREQFFHFQHGEGRRTMIERLAAAHGAGELPDYLFEFVDSLRMRTTRTTS
jgi:hypothetical protein